MNIKTKSTLLGYCRFTCKFAILDTDYLGDLQLDCTNKSTEKMADNRL